ncbi:MAG: carbohydrate ABC transporter permease, partial [Ruminococcus sp.]|nr:carbohydrate ABC transporter permease [Ruminococcus sp.]
IATVLSDLDIRLSKTLFNDATIKINSREQIVWKQAGCLLSITPILVLYACLQKYFTEGIERSGLVA